jgi:hypothetical protein
VSRAADRAAQKFAKSLEGGLAARFCKIPRNRVIDIAGENICGAKCFLGGFQSFQSLGAEKIWKRDF